MFTITKEIGAGTQDSPKRSLFVMTDGKWHQDNGQYGRKLYSREGNAAKRIRKDFVGEGAKVVAS